MLSQLPYYNGAVKEAIKDYVKKSPNAQAYQEEQAKPKEVVMPKNWLLPSKFKGQAVNEVPVAMLNSAVGDMLISFGSEKAA